MAFQYWKDFLWPLGGTLLGLLVVPIAIAQYPDFFNENEWILPISVLAVLLCWIVPLFLHERTRRIYSTITAVRRFGHVLFVVVCLAAVGGFILGSGVLFRFHSNHLKKSIAEKSKPNPEPEHSPLSEHTHIQWLGPQSVKNYHLLPLKPGAAQLGFGISNVGGFNFLGGQIGLATGVIPTALVPAAFSSAYRDIRHRDAVGTMVAHPVPSEGVTYETYWVRLTEDDVAKLKSGEKRLCAVGSVIWTDPSGTYETFMYRCMFAQPDGTFNWNLQAEDNTEQVYQVH